MSTIPDTPLLTADDERRLAITIEAGVLAAAALSGRARWPGDATHEELAELADTGRAAEHTFWMANLRLIKLVSTRVGPSSGVPEEDLFQDGWIGLADAVRRFDHRRGVRFATYALPWIRARIGEAVQRHRHPLRVPASRAGEPPPRAVPLDELQHSALSTDDDRAGDFDRVERAVVSWPDLLAALPAQQALALRLRYGLADSLPCTYDDLARRLGCSVSTTRRLEASALTSLRRLLSYRGVESSVAVRTA